MVSEKVSPLEVKNEQKSKKKKSKKKNQSGKNKYTSNNTVSKDESFDYGENRINLNNYGKNLNFLASLSSKKLDFSLNKKMDFSRTKKLDFG